MKRILKPILYVLAIIIIFISAGIVFITRGLESGSKVAVGNINLESINDGTYKGKYEGGRWSNEMIITVKDHKITDVKVVKDVLFKKSEVTEAIIEKVIQEQKINVPVVSGATVTSKAYLKAIENSLKESLK